MKPIIAAVLLFAACTLAAGAPSARAASACSYDSSTGTAGINLVPGSATPLRIEVGAGGKIDVGGSECGAATVTNTQRVLVLGTDAPDTFDISLAGGPFTGIAFTVNLAAGHDQVRVFGTTGDDHIVIGAPGIDLDPDTSRGPDVTLVSVESILVNGLAGADAISGQGGTADGAPDSIPLTLTGAGGNDTLTGGAGNDTISGNDNDDVLDGKGGNDLLFGNKGSDVIRGGAGFDATFYSGMTVPVVVTEDGKANDGAPSRDEHDNVSADVEKIVGGDAGDHITGGPGPNQLFGGPGNDYLNGGGGTNTCIGGKGADYLVHC